MVDSPSYLSSFTSFLVGENIISSYPGSLATAN